MTNRQQARRRLWLTATFLSFAMTGAGPLGLSGWGAALAQAAAREISIPAGDLTTALNRLAAQTGLQILFPAELANGLRTTGLSGAFTPSEALSRLLSGTPLTYGFTSNNTVTISDRFAGAAELPDDGSIALAPIEVGTDGIGVGWDGSAETVYTTPGTVSHISKETLEHYPGTSPADVLKSASGVFSGESRNSGGLDVNIRGLQGQGRVPVTVDGTINSTSVYRGYQGVGNRSFIDPDFIGGISIEKGPSTGASGAGAIGGTVAMTTITADDIVPEGETFGVRLKTSLGTNTTEVESGFKSNLLQPTNGIFESVDRPGLLEPTSGSASAVLASKTENFDFVAGFARRKSGNYHAGENGPDAPEKDEDFVCPYEPDYCSRIADWYEGPGLTPFVGGEEVLNTSQDTKSALVKGTARVADDHTLELTYSKYLSEFGENYPSSLWQNTQTIYQGNLSKAELDRYSSRYRWNPDSDLFDLKWNIWRTELIENSVATGGYADIAKWIDSWGTDVSNTSRFTTPVGELIAEYGAAYLSEETGPEDGEWTGVPGREGTRAEASYFARGSWLPTDWLQLDAGLRYQDFEVHGESPYYGSNDNSDDALGYHAGVTVTPFEGVQLFGSYKEAARLPSLMEGTRGFLLLPDPELGPEVAHDWEFGVNLKRDNLFAEGDNLGVKFTYFNNDIDNYISRTYSPPEYPYQMFIHNIDRAKFEGFDLSARYDFGSFSAELSGAYFTDVTFCRTADSCKNSSLSADYATNQIPPEYSASLALSKSFFDDRLTLGGRVTYVGPRAAEAEATSSGAYPFVAPIPWEPYTLVDLFGSYKLNDNVTLDFSVENLTDIYYVEPLNLGRVPGPGRTFRVGMTGEFSPNSSGGNGLWPFPVEMSNGSYDWTGLYFGGHAGYLEAIAQAKYLEVTLDGMPIETGDRYLGDIEGNAIGVQLGYNYQFANHLVVGVEADYSSTQADITAILSSYPNRMENEMDWTASARLRAGVAFGRFFAYGTGGWSAGGIERTWFRDAHTFEDSGTAQGWTVGGGIEYALTDNLTIRGEYLFSAIDTGSLASYDDPEGDQVGLGYSSKVWYEVDQFRLGLNYKF